MTVSVSRRTRPGMGLAVGLTVATVLAQVAYPLTPPGPPRDRLTVFTVVLFFLASVCHAAVTRGAGFAFGLLTVTTGGGLLAEALGVATGWPFGQYLYGDSLGWQLVGVPVVIPLAWTMMAYPALLVGRRIAGEQWWGPLVAGWALASWDLFLDPQMVAAGHWRWAPSSPALLGVPLSNFAAWTLVATAMMALLWRAGRWEPTTADRLPLGLYLWTYGSSVLAHAAFFGLPGSALAGGLGMGVVVLALVRRR